MNDDNEPNWAPLVDVPKTMTQPKEKPSVCLGTLKLSSPAEMSLQERQAVVKWLMAHARDVEKQWESFDDNIFSRVFSPPDRRLHRAKPSE